MSRPGAVIINLTLVISIMLCPVVFSQVRRPSGRVEPGPTWTPTPVDPCAHCPPPESVGCWINYEACVDCWEECGQPIATPTPTRTPTPAATPTPNGPVCELRLGSSKMVYLIVTYAHESPTTSNIRYRVITGSQLISPGQVVRPCPCQGHPIGFAWHDARTDDLLLKCGDVRQGFGPLIFADGFETGDTSKWIS